MGPSRDDVDEANAPHTSLTFGFEQRDSPSRVARERRHAPLLRRERDVAPDAARTPRGLVAAARHLPFALLVVLYVGWFIHLSLVTYDGYGYPPFDLSIFDQGLWLLTHGHAPFVTVMGRNLFGDHTSFILFLVAPFYRLVPEPQGLLVLQSLLLAAAAVPIYVLARKRIRNTIIATLLAGAFLLSPILEQGNLDQFHPEAFQVLIIAVAIYAALESRYRLLVVMVVLSLLVKEDAALLVVPLGVWVLLRRSRRLGAAIVLGSLAYAAVANALIIPSILGASSIYASRIPFGGVGGTLATLVRRPGQFWSYLYSQSRPFYLFQLGMTSGFGFLLAPEIASVGTLVVLENLLSLDPYMHQIVYQYSLSLVPVLALGVVYAVARQRNRLRQFVVAVIVVACALWSCVLWGLAPFSSNSVYTLAPTNSATIRAIDYVEAAVPPDAIVAAWYPLVPHLDHRVGIYVWPTPFSAQNWGLFTQTGTRLPVASRVQYLVLPVPLTPSEDPTVFRSIADSFTLVRERDGFALYESTAAGAPDEHSGSLSPVR